MLRYLYIFFLLLLFLQNNQLIGTEIITVTVTGYGKTVEDAEKNALQIAVRKAVGEIVDAETITENEEVIKDKVLSYSDALVWKHQLASKPKINYELGGLFMVEMKAEVVRGKVMERLKAAQISTSEMNGRNLWGRAVSEIDRLDKGKEMLKVFMQKIPISAMFKTRLVSKDSDGKLRYGDNAAYQDMKINFENGTVELIFYVEVAWDTNLYYQKLAPRILNLLNLLSDRNTNKQSKVSYSTWNDYQRSIGNRTIIADAKVFLTDSICQLVADGTQSFGLFGSTLNHGGNNMHVALATNRANSGMDVGFEIRTFNRQAYEEIFSTANWLVLPNLNLVLEDNMEKIISKKNWSISTTPRIRQGFTHENGSQWKFSHPKYSFNSDRTEMPKKSLLGFFNGNFIIIPEFRFRSLERSRWIGIRTDSFVCEKKIILTQSALKKVAGVKVFMD
jgi:hypothetical protein